MKNTSKASKDTAWDMQGYKNKQKGGDMPMRQIKRMFRMHRIFVTQELKRMMEYKANFIVGIIAFLLGQMTAAFSYPAAAL